MDINDTQQPKRTTLTLATNTTLPGGTIWYSLPVTASTIAHFTAIETTSGSATPHLTTIQGSMDNVNYWDMGCTVTAGQPATQPTAYACNNEMYLRAKVDNSTETTSASATVSILLGVQVY